MRGGASAIANAATRTALDNRTQFGDNLRAAIPDVIGQALWAGFTAPPKPAAQVEDNPGDGTSSNGGKALGHRPDGSIIYGSVYIDDLDATDLAIETQLANSSNNVDRMAGVQSYWTGRTASFHQSAARRFSSANHYVSVPSQGVSLHSDGLTNLQISRTIDLLGLNGATQFSQNYTTASGNTYSLVDVPFSSIEESLAQTHLFSSRYTNAHTGNQHVVIGVDAEGLYGVAGVTAGYSVDGTVDSLKVAIVDSDQFGAHLGIVTIAGDVAVGGGALKVTKGLDDALPAFKRGKFGPAPFKKLTANDLNTLKNIRKSHSVRKRSNIAFLEGSVDGNNLTGKFSVSGKKTPGLKLQNDTVLFQASKVDGNLRNVDSEFFLLNNVAVSNNLTRRSTGRFSIVSERTVCTSCNGVVDQFRAAFPNIELTVRHGGKNGIN